ncbi:MAG: Tn3 family transposase [Usitatibacteraceae bacterium]
MESWRQQYLGLETVPASLTNAEIDYFFAPSEQAWPFVLRRRSPLSRLGLIIHIGFLRMTGRPLSSVDRIPAPVLDCAARYADMVPPQIATLRAIYKRRPTLFDHQKTAATAVGLKPYGDQAIRHVTGFLRKQCGSVISRDELVRDVRLWLYDHGYMLPGLRPLEKLAAAAQLFALNQLKASITKVVEPVKPASWTSQLAANGPNPGESLLDWLRGPPGGFGRRDIAEGQDRIDALKRLGAAEIEIDNLPVERMRAHARRIARRKASTLHKLKEPRRTVEIGCWLRLQLLELTDTILEQTSRRIGQLWADAQRAVEARAVREIERYRLGIGVIANALDNPELSPESFRETVVAAISPLREIAPSQSKLHSIRAELANAPTRLRAMLRQVGALDLSIATDHPLNLALTTLRKVYDKGRNGITAEEGNPFAPAAARLVSATSTAADRLAAYEVATGMLLKRCLRNGEASARHSVLHRSVADQLMSEAVWQKVRTQTSRAQGWPKSLDVYLKRFEPSLAEGLASLSEVVRRGEIGIDDDRFRIPKLKAVPKDPQVDVSRKRLFAEIGNIQLPDIIVSVDERTRFSSVLLGRHATSPDDLESLYAGLLALGTEKTASEMARMLDGISEDRIELAMRMIEESGHLREANDLVASATAAQPLAALWGEGIAASADMMSLDATRHLWNARIEPRRGTHAVGTYTHVSDQWSIIYDRPILLNIRQAGAALEGAVEQKVIDLQRLAVDTHGFTHFAMATAKLLGFDLSPRLADLSNRKLYLPQGVVVPPELEPVVERIRPGRTSREGWDGLLKLVASLKTGYGSVATIIERHGSAASGTPVFECGTLVGKIVRSLFLLDFLTKAEFRREVHKLLSQGESVHQLQRALMAGNIKAKQGRTLREITAVSGALSLLTNIVMLWNTQAMQQAVGRLAAGDIPEEHLARIAPVAYRHINMNGKMRFALEDYAWLARPNIRRVAGG